MTDKEKIAMLVGFLKGSIGGNDYYSTLDVKAALEIIKEVM